MFYDPPAHQFCIFWSLVNYWTAHPPPPGCLARPRPCPPDLPGKSCEKAPHTHKDNDDKHKDYDDEEQDGKLVMKCWKAVCRHNGGGATSGGRPDT